MPRISKILNTGETLYLFSDDLMWGCRYHALQARKADNSYARFLAHVACVLNGAGVVEAKLNELTAQVTGIEDSKPYLPLAFWKTLHEARRSLSYVAKWNLIASASEGATWNNGLEPFQNYNLVVCLRNELTHYKGEYGDNANPPVKKLKGLMHLLKGKEDAEETTPERAFWVNALLGEPKLGAWVVDAVEAVDMRFDHLLAGKKFTKADEDLYRSRIVGLDPFRLAGYDAGV